MTEESFSRRIIILRDNGLFQHILATATNLDDLHSTQLIKGIVSQYLSLTVSLRARIYNREERNSKTSQNEQLFKTLVSHIRAIDTLYRANSDCLFVTVSLCSPGPGCSKGV